ncbi:MAG TPA: porin family protein [Chitinophagaceae bacterium]
MKKLILIVFVLASAFVASAQVQYGIKAGLNVANLKSSGITYDNGTSLSSKTDFNAGIMAAIPLFSNAYLQPELSFSGQGQKYTSSVANGTINYDYLNLPVLFKYQHSSGLFAESGPQIGFLLSAKIKINGYTIDQTQTQTVDFSWAFGLGYKLQSIPVGIDLRYNLGLTSVNKESGTATIKNSVFQFDVFYLFGVK